MALIAKVISKSGKSRAVTLLKSVNVVQVDADEVVTIVDEATGDAVEGVELARHGNQISVTIPEAYFASAPDQLAQAEGAAPSETGAATDAAQGGERASAADTGGHGGGNGGLALGLLGGLGAIGAIAAASGGGGKNSGGSTPDTTAPSAPDALGLAADDDTGTSNSDRITSNTSALTITGNAEANATVEIKEGSTVLGSGQADANGKFSIDVALGEGTHNVTAAATDAAGNLSPASSPLAVTIDTSAPTVTISSSASMLLGSQPATVTFTFTEAPAGFSADDVAVNGGTISALAVSPDDPKIYTATLTPTATQAGSVSLSIAAGAFADVAGNASVAAGALDLPFDPGTGGQAIDGYIANAFVFRDADNDGLWDHESFNDANNNGLFDAGETFVDANGDGSFTAEYHTTTDARGDFSNLFGSGRIVLTPLIAGDGTNLTTDISTGKAFTGQLTASAGSTVVTPLTTIVEALAGSGATAEQVAAASAQVKAALGISDSVDLATFDPIAAAVAATDSAALANAVNVQKAAVQIANILSVVASASGAAGVEGGAQTGMSTTISVIADQIAAGGTVDLASADLVGQIVQAVAASTTDPDAASALTTQSASISASLASVNNAVSQASGSDAVSTLAAIVTTQIVAQNTLVNDVSTAIANDTLLDSEQYQGSALADKIDTASTQVQAIAPADEAPGQVLEAPDRPVVDDGTRVSAAEAADGVTVTVTYSAEDGMAAGDSLRLLVGNTVVKTVVLAAADIPASGATGSMTFTLSQSELGADGTKSISAGFVLVDGTAGPLSLPYVTTLDTSTTVPVLAQLSGGAINAVEAAAGVSGTLGGLEVGSTAAVTLSGMSAANGQPLSVAVATSGNRFTLDPAVLAQFADGTLTVSATQTDPAGNLSGVGTTTVILDTAAPGAPAGLGVSEGPLVTVVEGAGGTIIAGTTESGSIVRVTLTNGEQTLVKEAQVTGTAFALALSAAEIAQLGEGYVQYSAVATDAAGNVGPQSATGQYFYTAQPIVDSTTRLDAPGSRVVNEGDDGGIVGVTPLAGGGFAVHWVVDADGDGDGDGLAVQRFGADGSKQGAITVLQGISQDLIANAGEDVSYDLRALEGGGYALTYMLGLEEAGRVATVTANAANQTLGIPIVGRPDEFYIVSAPANAVFSLSGVDNAGMPKTVTLTVVDGEMEITQAILDEFGLDNRLNLQVTGLNQGESAQVAISTLEDVHYDTAAALDDVATSFTVLPSGVGVIATGTGRPEAFQIGSASNAPSFVIMQITPPNGGHSIDLSGVPGASVLPNGVIQIGGLTPDANGVYHVPETILSQLGEGDAQAILILGGLTAGSTLTGTVSVREPIANPEGVFVQTFDANGMALGDASDRLDAPGSRVVNEGDDGGIVGVTPLAGGGFAVHWVVDADGDGDGDGLAVQRFGADGSKQGAITVLQGISQDLIANAGEDVSYDLRALEGGGYALTYMLGLEEAGRVATVIANAANQTLGIPIVGRPDEFYIASAPANAVFSLSGVDNAGMPKTVTLTVVDGEMEITQAILDEFGLDNRLNLQVTGLNQGESAQVAISTLEDVHYDTAAALDDVATSFTVLPSGVGVIATGTGRPEAFQIGSASNAPSFVIMQITPPNGGHSIDLSGVPGASVLPNGVIQIGGLTPDANGVYHVPETILSQLGEGDAQAILILGGLTAGSTLTGTVSVREPIANPEGVFVQAFDANGMALGDASDRLDAPGSRVVNEGDDGGIVGVTPLAGGGFAVHWVVDADGDGDGDGLAVQRFGADGSKQGAITVLQGISQDLIANAGEDVSYDLRALEGGGYALTYMLGLEEAGRVATVIANAANQTLGIPIVGRPDEFYIVSAPANAVFSLSGVDNAGMPKTVTLTVVDGEMEITQAILDEFGLDNRLNLQVTGLNQGESAQVAISTLEDVHYDTAAALDDVATSFTVLPSGVGVIATGTGRPEAFQIGSASNAPSFVIMQITPPNGGHSIDLSGVPGASVLPNGVIQIGGLTPDANGVYHVPETILSQLGEGDAQAILILGGLTAGSTLTGTVSVREPIANPEGVFVQTFDANGMAVNQDLDLIGTNGNDVLVGDDGNDTLDGGAGTDSLTGGAGADIFVLEGPGGQTLTVADLITDFDPGADRLQLTGGLQFSDVLVAPGDPATNGADATDALIVDNASGDILARLANVDPATITQAAFLS